MINLSILLIEWFTKNKRDLPWRENSTPYNIWISEIILQQTRVVQGIGYYERFVEAFPDVKSLANADQQNVLKLWQGLGYYSRARNLHKASQYIVSNLNGVFPDSYIELLKLPGVGPYTAAAIASIAFNQSVVAIDGNAKRVFARLFNINKPIDQNTTIEIIRSSANEFIDKDRPGDFNQAVMELGATVCLPKKPLCSICPVAEFCEARKQSTQNNLPVKVRKVKVRNRYFNYFVFIYKSKTCLLERKEDDIWKGLNEFPLIESIKELNGDEIINLAMEKWSLQSDSINKVRFSKSVKHILSHQHIYAVFCVVELSNVPQKINLNININEVNKIPVSRLTEIFLSKDEKFI
jgi:A/G-specific adenine glycosylase